MKESRTEEECGVNHRHKAWAEIDLAALRHNYREICARARAGTPEGAPLRRVFCVVKADAYGHGATAVCQTLAEEGARDFAVSSTEEALGVRSAIGENADSTILILGYSPTSDVQTLLQNHITQTVTCLSHAQTLNDALHALIEEGTVSPDEQLAVHISIDTGMNRIGISACGADGDGDVSDCIGAIAQIAALPHLRVDGIFSHFACADEPGNPMTDKQSARFAAVLAALEARGIRIPCRHLCNSAGILTRPNDRYDAVRAGLILYGLSPMGESGAEYGLRPVMKLRCLVSHIHTMRAGETVSYGAMYRAEKDMRIATLAIGYADGFLRAFVNGGSIRIAGVEAPLLGRVCMDMCMADVSNVPEDALRVGDVVTLFGDDDGEKLSHFAAVANTIHYELVCLIAKRVSRILV